VSELAEWERVAQSGELVAGTLAAPRVGSGRLAAVDPRRPSGTVTFLFTRHRGFDAAVGGRPGLDG
jgi:hypothetical protein